MRSEPGDSPEDRHDAATETFAPTSGRVTGGLGLAMAAGIVVLWAVDPDSVSTPVAAGALLGAVLAWAALLRPRVSVSPETLHLRNMLVTIHIPLAAIDELLVRQVLTVRVGEKKYACPAVGRKLRKVMGSGRPKQIFGPSMGEVIPDDLGPEADHQHQKLDIDYADHVEERLKDLIADARARHGIRRYSDEAEALARDVRREPAWLEIGGIVLAGTLLVLSILQ